MAEIKILHWYYPSNTEILHVNLFGQLLASDSLEGYIECLYLGYFMNKVLYIHKSLLYFL